MAAPHEPNFVWKLTSAAPGASHHAHGREVEFSSFYQGIFPNHSRVVGRGNVTIVGWGEILVDITEFERLLPPPSTPSGVEVLHMAWILGTAALYGFMARDANPRNWGRRATKAPADAHELVLIDVAGWSPSERGFTPDTPFPQRMRILSWWNWVEASQPTVSKWLRSVLQAHHRDLRMIFSFLYWQLLASGQATPVVAALLRQECLYYTPTGEPAVAAPFKGTLQPSDWRLLSLKPVEASQLLGKEAFGLPPCHAPASSPPPPRGFCEVPPLHRLPPGGFSVRRSWHPLRRFRE